MLPGPGQGLSQSFSKRAFYAGPLMALLSLASGRCWHLAVDPGGGDQLQVIRGCFLQAGSILYPWTIQVSGPAPACYRARDGSKSSGQGCRGGRMWLQRIAMVTGTFLVILEVFNHCSVQCTTKQPSARHWDFRPLLMPMFPRIGRRENGTPGGGSLLLDKITQVKVLNWAPNHPSKSLSSCSCLSSGHQCGTQ